MSEERILRPYIPEFSQAGVRSEAQRPSSGAPQGDNELYKVLNKLAKIAQAGDLAGWKKTLPEMESAAKAAKVDLTADLETRVALKQWELTLFVQASKVARNQARYAEIKAGDAQLEDRGDQARQLFQRAQKFNELADYLTQQLRAKTA